MSTDSGFQVVADASLAYDQHAAVFMAPMVELLLDRAAPQPGDHVLDIACGTGFVSRAAAARVGAGGRVAGLDLNPGMLSVAAQRSAHVEPAITWHQASAQDLPFDAAEFDHVVCQQGIEFFPDLDGAVTEMARVARPGATVAATVWTDMEDSPYLHAQYLTLAEFAGEDAVASLRHAFRLRESDLRRAWEGAGLRDITIQRERPEATLTNLDTYVGDHFAATPWGPTWAGLGVDGQRRATQRIIELLGDAVDGGSATVPFGIWVVAGTR